MTTIIEGIPYRIQNFDYQFYLELHGVSDSLVTRVRKESAEQQWMFKKSSTDDSFTIQNTFNGSWIAVLTDGGNSYAAGTSDETNAGKWSITFVDDSWEIKTKIGTSTDISYLKLAKYGSVILNTPSSGDPKRDDQKWTLSPSSSVIPDGDYRIRTLNGKYVLTMPSTNTDPVYTTEPTDGNSTYQKWTIKRSGINYYELKNQSYTLSPENGLESDGATVLGSSSLSYIWQINAAGSFGYTFNSGDFSIGFASYQAKSAQKVVLLKSLVACSQIWLFEPSATGGGTGDSGTGDSGTGDDGTEDIPADNNPDSGDEGGVEEITSTSAEAAKIQKRWTVNDFVLPASPQLRSIRGTNIIAEGLYYVVNIDTNAFIDIQSLSSIIATTSEDSELEFKLQVSFNGKDMRMAAQTQGGMQSIIPSDAIGGLALRNRIIFSWTLSAGPNSGTYYICVSKAPTTVISNEPGSDQIKIVNKSLNSSGQLWKFVRIP